MAASGNVIFDNRKADVSAIASRIGKAIQEAFGFDSLVVVSDRDEIVSAISDNPFHGDGQDKFVNSIFLDCQPTQADFDALVAEHRAQRGERLALGKRELYLDYVLGVGVSSLTGPFFKRRLGCRGTARNMTSLKRILAKMDS